MLKIRLAGLIILIALLSHGVAIGEAIPPKVGTVNTYCSDNTKYTVAIEILGYPDSSSSRCTFTDSGKIVWSKLISTTPSKVVIAENGQCIAMTNWGWYDEGASRSLSLYDRMGNLIKELSFGDLGLGYEGLKWIRTLAIAPDASYCVIGTDKREHALFTLFNCSKAELLWEKEHGFSDAAGAKLSNDGEYILIATNDYHSGDMRFFLLDRQGAVLYQKTLTKNFSWDVPDYLFFDENKHQFAIFDYNAGKFLVKALPEK